MTQIADAFSANVAKFPDKEAIWCDGISMTYAEFGALVNDCRDTLSARGVRRADHIGVLLPNCIEFAAVMLAAADLGAALVPLSPALPANAIHTAFAAADVRHLIGTRNRLSALQSADHDFTFANGSWTAIGDTLEAPDAQQWKELQAIKTAPNPETESAQDDDAFILTMTSGSTGDPKPIVLTQRTKFNRAAAAVELYSITAADRTLAATPLYHSLAERLVLTPLLTGGTAVVMSRFSPSEWLKCVAEQSVTFTIAVSSQLRSILERLTDDVLDELNTLRCIVSSSALLEDEVKTELVAKLHCDFHECYGTSEIAIASNLGPEDGQDRLNTVGRAAPGVEIKILDDDGNELPPNTPGEIACRTPMIFGGYYKRPDLTRDAMQGDFFCTGDLGRLDEDAYLYFLGRKKEIIITGGINVYPADIDAIIGSDPAVAECAAFAYPDDNLGEIVAVAVVPQNPDEFEARSLRFLCARQLADYQQPRKYFVVESLPKNAMGKLMRRKLLDLVTES